MTAAPPPRRRRWLWLALRAGVTLAVLGWVGRYAWLRLTVMPPRSVDEWDRIAAELFKAEAEPNDASEELARIASALATPVPYSAPDTAGTTAQDPPGQLGAPPNRGQYRAVRAPQELDFQDAIAGPWIPDKRPHLAAIIAHLESPKIRELIGELESLQGRPWRMEPYRLESHRTRQAVDILATDARLHVEQGEFSVLVNHVRTAVWLTDRPRLGGPAMLSYAWSLPYSIVVELCRATREHRLPPQALRELGTVLANEPDLGVVWAEAVQCDRRQTPLMLDFWYTRDAAGDGWLDVDRYLRVYDSDKYSPEAPSRAWNLFAGMYRGRKQVLSHLQQFYDAVTDLGGLSGPEFRSRTDYLLKRSPFSALDGPLRYYGFYCQSYFRTITEQLALRRAVRVIVALSLFETDHGAFPQTLEKLVPQYLPEPLRDPTTGEYFVYEPNGGTYELSNGAIPTYFRTLYPRPRPDEYVDRDLVQSAATPDAQKPSVSSADRQNADANAE